MAYSKQTWVNRSTSATTPLSASRLNHIEDGLEAAAADADSALAAAYTDEQVRDVIGTALVAGSNVTITPDDGANTITIAASGGGGGGSSVAIQKTLWNAGDKTTTSTSFTDVDTTHDLTITAASGNTLQIGLSGVVAASTSSGYIGFDVQTRVSGSGVNYVSSGTSTALVDGITGWRHQDASTNLKAIGGQPFLYTVQSGDVSSGSVTLRLRWRVNSGVTGTLYADGTNRTAQFWVMAYA